MGTAFNIELLDANSIEVAVTEGKVLVDKTGARDNQKGIAREIRAVNFDKLESDDLLLSVGEKAVVAKGQEKQVAIPESFDIATDLAWREGMLIFEGESLDEAISEINRYTALTLEITDDSIRNIEVGGYFRAGDTDELLVILENNFGIHSERKGDRLFLRGTLN